MRERNPLEGFLPRSGSIFVFIPVVACYGFAITALFAVMVAALHFPPRPPSFWDSRGDPAAHAIEALAFAPLFESCFLIAVIELLRWLRTPTVVQVLLAAAAVAAPHSYTWGLGTVCVHCRAELCYSGRLIYLLASGIPDAGFCGRRIGPRTAQSCSDVGTHRICDPKDLTRRWSEPLTGKKIPFR